MTEAERKKKEREKKRKSVLEAEIFAFMQKNTKAALDAALDDIFKEWK